MSRYDIYQHTNIENLIEKDFYPTPPHAALKAAGVLWQNHIKPGLSFSNPVRLDVLDPGCGDGPLGTAWRDVTFPHGLYSRLYGTELATDRMAALDLRDEYNHPVYDAIAYGFDHISPTHWKLTNPEWELPGKYDVIFANPPFSLFHQFFNTNMKLLLPGGVMGMFAPLSYLTGIKRRNGQMPQTKTRTRKERASIPPIWNHCLETVYIFTRRIDWSGKGKPNDQHIFAVWRNDQNFARVPTIDWID